MVTQNHKLLLASAVLVVSAMCLDSLVGTNMSLIAIRQGTSDTFDVSLSFTAMDENGTAISGATVYCSDSSGGTYSQAGTTDSKGAYSSSNFLVSTMSSTECPKKRVTRYCYAQKGDVKTNMVSGTAELTCYVSATPTAFQTSTPTPPVIPAEKYCEKDADCACGRHIRTGNCFYGNIDYVNTAQQCPDFCTGIAGNLIIGCVKNECKQITPTPTATTIFCTADVKLCPDGSYVGRNPKAGCEFYPCPSTTTGTPTATPTPAGCGNTHTGVWPATCSSVCSAAGKTCVRQSSCDGVCVSALCASSCGGSGDVMGCVCS